MNQEKLEKELEFFQGEVFFITSPLLPEFIWNETTQEVVPYHSAPNKNNSLVVYQTEIIDVKGKKLEKILTEMGLEEKDVLVVINHFLPESSEKFVRIKIIKIKFTKKKKNEI